MMTTSAPSIASVLDRIRPALRGQHAYLFGLEDHIEIKLNQNENPYDWPRELKEALTRRLIEIPWNRYPNDQPFLFQQALAAYLGLTPAHILVGNGSNEMMLTVGAVMIQPGTKVILAAPLFSLYDKIVRIHDGEVIAVPMNEDLSYNIPALLEAIHTHQPVLTVVGAPNNPTGGTIEKADLFRILDAAEGFVLVDEAYVDFTDDGRGMQDALDDYPNLLIIRTFSKSFALAGLRLGYLLAHPAVAAEILKYRSPFMIDFWTEQVGIVALEHLDWMREKVAELREGTQMLYQALQAIEGVEQVLPTTANFTLFRTRYTGAEIIKRMSAHNILLRNMSGYTELKDFIRVNCGTPEENQTFLAALKNVLSER